MAKSLGYTDVITREDIRNPYVPQGMVDSTNANALIQSGIANIVQQWSAGIQQTDKHIETR